MIGKFVGKLVGKFVGNVGWKCWVENLVEKCWVEKNVGKFGWKKCWKCWVEMLGGKNVAKFVGKNVGNVGLEIWLEKMLVNGCEIIGEKIVATNLPLRLSTTVYNGHFQSFFFLSKRSQTEKHRNKTSDIVNKLFDALLSTHPTPPL